MKPDQLYQELKALADKLNLQVLEQNFRPTGIRVKSGYCKFKGLDHCIIDKNLKKHQKADVLAECLTQMSLESIYIIPSVREYLDRFHTATAGEPSFDNSEEVQVPD
ncbi:MAG: hypothetical protein C4519_11770 [Desulfobacteraceae bacterium]|nr:MAG: hypothetical protein C4519_11770 [Desulfobacteraceae bacterium]